MEVVVDSHYTVWIIGSKGIYFYDNDGELDKDTEKENIEFRKVCYLEMLSSKLLGNIETFLYLFWIVL